MIGRIAIRLLGFSGIALLAKACAAPLSSPEITDGGENECNRCHPGPGDRDFDRVHRFHLFPNVTTPRACVDCHPVPAPGEVWDTETHIDNSRSLILQTWQFLTKSWEEGWHGDRRMFWQAKRYPQPLGCTTDDCHRVTDPPHLITDLTRCFHCHPATMDPDGNLLASGLALHVNGETNKEIGCDQNCHPYPSDLGAHETHRTTRWLPMRPESELCTLCHSPSSEKEISGQIWRHFAGEFFLFGGLAIQGGRQPTMTTNEKGVVACLNTFCHVDGQPAWDEVWPTERGERCQKCHIEPEGDQHSGDNLLCTECHEAELADGRHGDEIVETLK